MMINQQVASAVSQQICKARPTAALSAKLESRSDAKLDAKFYAVSN